MNLFKKPFDDEAELQILMLKMVIQYEACWVGNVKPTKEQNFFRVILINNKKMAVGSLWLSKQEIKT